MAEGRDRPLGVRGVGVHRAAVARAAAGGEPAIELRPRAVDGCLEIDVIDSGGGVSREEAEGIFERFARGSRAGRHTGAGLGLAISRTMMRAMGGDLTVEFAADGTSFFRLRAPLAPVG